MVVVCARVCVCVCVCVRTQDVYARRSSPATQQVMKREGSPAKRKRVLQPTPPPRYSNDTHLLHVTFFSNSQTAQPLCLLCVLRTMYSVAHTRPRVGLCVVVLVATSSRMMQNDAWPSLMLCQICGLAALIGPHWL